MPLTIPASNLKSWKKFSSNFYFYPSTDEDSDNHIHVRVENASKEVLTIKSISVKISGRSTNLRVGTAANDFKFHPDGATWPAEPAKTRYVAALRKAGLIA